MPTRHDRLDLVPGHSLGPFQLGSLLFNVLNHVRSYTQAYPHVDIAWDDQNSSTTDIFVVLATPPIHLSFEARSQRLYRIELDPSASYHLDSAADRSLTTTTVRRRRQRPSAADWVSYRGKLFRDPRPEPLGRGSLDRNRDDDDDDGDEDEDERDDVVRRIRTVLGPTHLPTKLAPPRSGDEEEEMLNYPGVALGITTGRGSRLKRIILTLAPNESTKVSRHAALASLPIASGDLDFVDIVLDRSTRIPTAAVLHFHSLATSSNRDERSRGGGGRREGDEPIAPVRLELGHTTHEDIVCQLGSSVRSFWKEDDRLSIHNVGDRVNPYFVSYPHLGLTLMLRQEPDPGRGSTLECLHKGGGERGRRGGGGAHTLEKVILHSNLPGQINFGRTSRSNWRFALGQNDEDRRDDEQRTGETLTLGTTIGGDDKFDQLKQFLRGSTDGKDEGKQKEDRDESRSASTSRSPGRVSDDKSSANGRADEEESSPAETPKSDTTLALPSATLQVTGGGGVQTGGSIGSIGSSSSNKKKKKKGTTSSAGGNSTPPPPPSTSPLPSTSLHLSPSSEPPRTEADQIERSQDRARDSRGRDDDDDVLSRGTSRDEVERHVEEEETARGDRAVANSAPEKDDDEDEEPMILDRTATLTSPALVNDDRRGVRGRSEFGSTGNGLKGRTTELHGFPGIVLEVTKSRDVETVWLF